MLLDLTDHWTVRAVGGGLPADLRADLRGVGLPAAVPGSVHLDLLAAGVIPDPHLDDQERLLAWIGHVDWRYETTFAWAPAEHVGEVCELVAEGLDTFATVELNGTVIGRTQNMHRTFVFDVGSRLRAGANTLAVTFAAGVPATQRASEAIGPLPHINTHPFNAARKMASNYGWDWGPDLVTAGLWRPIGLRTWRRARLSSVRPLVDVDGDDGVLTVHVGIAHAAVSADGRDRPPTEADVSRELTVEVTLDGVRSRHPVPPGAQELTCPVRVPSVRRWWPVGHGDQPLYDLSVVLFEAAEERDDWHGRVGFRTVRLDTTPDEHGTPFQLVVNDVPLFVRGVNWIPDDSFPSRITPQRYAARLTQARDAGVNLVRVWGGGIYESEDFYRRCDELGLLVWQDFLFACAAYSEEEPLRAEVVAEAREAVTRLSAHASLALWNGGNENIWGHADWDWQRDIGSRTWGWGYYTDLLPAIVAELDPTRPYSPGSPFSFRDGVHPNDPDHGTMHIWDVWNERDYTAYADYVPRFLAEFGFQGPPTWRTLVDAVHDRPLRPDSAGMLVHQKAEDGNEKLHRGLSGHLPVPADMEDWHWATSLNQARAIRFGVEHFRSWWPRCSGTVLWQLNDCWPVTSWAAVDGAGRLKPLWYALRQSYADRLLTIRPRDSGLALVAVNDSDRAWDGEAVLERLTLAGERVGAAALTLRVAPRSVQVLALPPGVVTPGDPRAELLRVRSGATVGWHHFVEDLDAALPPADLTVRVVPQPDAHLVHVTARSYARDVSLLVDRLGPRAEVDDMLRTLMPGESTTFRVTGLDHLSADEASDPRVLRSSNQLVHVARLDPSTVTAG